MAGIGKELMRDAVVAVVVIGVGYYMIKKGAKALNPADPDNIINQGVESAYKALTGSSGTIGGDIYDVLHDQQGGNVLNPANSNNPINQGVEWVYKGLTGSSGTIGGDIYDVLHDQQGRNKLNPFNWFD